VQILPEAVPPEKLPDRVTLNVRTDALWFVIEQDANGKIADPALKGQQNEGY
jgi:hypothetical protein